MVDQEVDFSVKMDSVMDIFRRTDMKIFSKEVLKRMSNVEAKPAKKTEAEWLSAFYSGLGDPDEKDQMDHKRQLLKSIITKKTADSLDVKKLGNLSKLNLNSGQNPTAASIKEKVEDSAWVMKAKLFSNFKALNLNIQNSMEYKLPTTEIIKSVTDELFVKNSNLDEHIRKKFLQEKIELLLRMVRDLRDAEKIKVVQKAKIEIIREAIHYRYLYKEKEEKYIESMKKSGVISLKNVRLDAMGSEGSAAGYVRRSTMRRKRNNESNATENQVDFQEGKYPNEFNPKDFTNSDLQESTMIFSRHLLVQKRLTQEIEMLKEDLELLSEKKHRLDTKILLYYLNFTQNSSRVKEDN